MAFFKDVGTFFTRKVPKFVTKTLPKAISSIPDPGDAATWEPELPGLRKREAATAKALETSRSEVFEWKARLAQAHADYRALLEDYSARHGAAAAAKRFARVRDTRWNDPSSDVETVLDGLGGTLRGVGGFLTLGLSEAIFKPGEAAREKEFLKERISRMRALNTQMQTAISQLREAATALEAEISAARAEFAVSGADNAGDAASLAQLAAAANAERLETAGRMRADGLAPALIAMVTGLEVAIIEALPGPPPA